MINIGVIGYGYWGPNLVRNFMKVEECCVRMIADRDPQRLKSARRDYPTVATSTEVRTLLQRSDIDAVAIATPVSSHYALARWALENGKHVLIEKPMTRTSDECQHLLDLAASANRLLMVDHTFLYTGAVRKMKEIIAGQQLGQIYYFDSVRINLGLFQHDVNVIWDLAPHDLSIMHYLIEERPMSIAAVGASHVRYANPPLENIAYITLNSTFGVG